MPGPKTSPEKNREYRERFAAKQKVYTTTKTCLTCEKRLLRSSFSKMAASKDGLQSYCKSCNRQRNTLRRLGRYGLDEASFQVMIDRQGGVCSICRKVPTQQGTVLWAIDHDHECCPGEHGCPSCIRGLLCNPCNRAIGLLGDDPELAMNAATYLMSTRDVLNGAWS